MSIDTSNNMDEYLKRQAAAAAGAGAAAASASTAASTAGQRQESAQGATMATAANTASTPVAKSTVDPVSGLPIKPAGTPTTVQTANVPMPTGMDTPAAKPFSTQAGDNVGAYINRTSATLGGDPGYATEAGRLAAERVTNGLKTPDASSVNAQNTEDTAASRRAYLARVQADESIGQSGFGAGTAQADRIRTTSAAGVNQANQAGQNGVNAYLRQRTEDNLNRAMGLEKDQYGKGRDNLADAERFDNNMYGRNERATDRGIAAAAVEYGKSRDVRRDSEYDASTAYNQGRDAVGDQRYASETEYAKGRDAIGDTRTDRAYTDSRTDKALDNSRWDTLNKQQQDQLAIENAAVASGKDDTAKRNLLASLPDGPAKNAVMAGLADGSLTLANALSKVMNADGTIKDGTEGGGVNYRGQTPGALGLEAEKEYAQQTVDMDDPTLKTTNPQLYLKRVNEEMLKSRNAKINPINDESETRDAKEALTNINDGKPEDGDFEKAVSAGLIEKYTPNTLPIDQGAQDLIGKTISYADKQYEVVAQGRVVNTRDGDTHQSYVVLQDPDGGVWYKSGATLSQEPPRNLDHGTDYQKYAVYDPNTKTLTYKTTKA